MFHPHAHVHGATWYPWIPDCHCQHQYHYVPYYAHYYAPYYHYPMYYQPYPHTHAEVQRRTLFLQEIVLEPLEGEESKDFFVGGESPVHLTLEYVPIEAAEEMEVEVATTESGTVTTWLDNDITEDYTVKNDFPALSPGAKVAFRAVGVVARLRWCEVVEC